MGDTMEILGTLIKIGFLYFLIITTYRLMGKKRINDLSIMDVIVILLLSNVISLGIQTENQSFIYLAIIITSIVVLQVIMTYLSSSIPTIKYLFNAKPTMIIKKGKLDFKELLKKQYNLEDLLKQLREKSIKRIEDVEYAVLENNGMVSIFGYNKIENDIPIPLILDGKIQYSSLKIIQKEVEWINNVISKENILLSNIFYAFYTKGRFYIIKNS